MGGVELDHKKYQENPHEVRETWELEEKDQSFEIFYVKDVLVGKQELSSYQFNLLLIELNYSCSVFNNISIGVKGNICK